MLQDHVVAKGLEYDNKYNLSSRLTGFLNTLQTNGIFFYFSYKIMMMYMLPNLNYVFSQTIR